MSIYFGRGREDSCRSCGICTCEHHLRSERGSRGCGAERLAASPTRAGFQALSSVLKPDAGTEASRSGS